MGNPYDDYVSLLLIYVMYYTMKSVCVIAVILPKNQKTSSNMSEKNITFEDLPKAMSWLMDKLNELDSKIDGLNNQNQSVPTEQWMNLKELCDYIPSHPAEQTVYGWTSCHLIPFHKRGKRIMFLKSEIEDKSDGSTKQKELSTTTVKNYLVPIPPYREQQRIVEKIKTVTSIMRG